MNIVKQTFNLKPKNVANKLVHSTTLMEVRLKLFEIFHINNGVLYDIFSVVISYAIVLIQFEIEAKNDTKVKIFT